MLDRRAGAPVGESDHGTERYAQVSEITGQAIVSRATVEKVVVLAAENLVIGNSHSLS
jgi:hypothetical protein